MYLEFYQLKELPFNVTPDPRFLFFARRHREAFDLVRYGIEHRKGFIVLCGEVGSGKTTLCRAVLASLPATQVRVALVLNPLLTETQLIRAILQDLGLPSASRDRLNLIDQLNGFLLTRAREGLNVAVIIDEAQNLTPAVMEQVRLLSNLETDQHKLLQIVLAGQPELKTRLALPELRQLRQRILVACELQPLNEEEVAHYLAYRLQVAGAAAADLFEAPAIRLVHRHSGGIPRLINALADRALMAGFVAAAPRIGKKEVARAIEDLGGLL
ncbi:MAG: AAA family ATPase [Kiritimatiellaeota bacterium]|nr:AAA family ATPase [Kiritimatiellota bacterium]